MTERKREREREREYDKEMREREGKRIWQREKITERKIEK